MHNNPHWRYYNNFLDKLLSYQAISEKHEWKRGIESPRLLLRKPCLKQHEKKDTHSDDCHEFHASHSEQESLLIPLMWVMTLQGQQSQNKYLSLKTAWKVIPRITFKVSRNLTMMMNFSRYYTDSNVNELWFFSSVSSRLFLSLRVVAWQLFLFLLNPWQTPHLRLIMKTWCSWTTSTSSFDIIVCRLKWRVSRQTLFVSQTRGWQKERQRQWSNEVVVTQASLQSITSSQGNHYLCVMHRKSILRTLIL